MASNNRKYLLSSDGRVFIKEKSECCPTPYDFYNCMRTDGIQKTYGEITPQFCPSPEKTGKYTEIATIKAAPSRATTSLIGRIPLNYDSTLYKLAKEGCEFDAQIHFGTCNNLDDFNEFDSAIVLENVKITGYNTDQLGSLTPDENALVNETINLSVGNWYTIRKLKITNIGVNGPLGVTGNSLFHVNTCQAVGCVNCCDEDCLLIALVGNTVLDRQEVWVSKDLGNTWVGPNVIPASNFIGGLVFETSVRSTSIACDQGDILISSSVLIPPGAQLYPRIWRTSITDLLNVASNFTLIWQQNVALAAVFTTNLTKFQNRWFVSTTGSTSPGNSTGWLIREVLLDGTNGFITRYDPNIHAASDRPERANWGLRAYKDEVMLSGVESLFAGTNQAYFAYSYDGTTWTEILMTYNGQPVIGQRTYPVPFGKNKWLIFVTGGTNVQGALYCTLDGGKTFKLIRISGHPIHSIFNNNIAYLVSGGNLQARFLRSYDFGYSWRQMPEDKLNNLPSITGNGQNSNIAFCGKNPNLVILGFPSNFLPASYNSGFIGRAE